MPTLEENVAARKAARVAQNASQYNTGAVTATSTNPKTYDVATTGTPTSSLSGRTIAQTNAANQTANYQNTLANNPNLSTAQQTYQTYIGADGRDTRQFDSYGQPIAGTGILSSQETRGVLGTPSVADPNQGTSTITGGRVTTAGLTGQTAGAMGQVGSVGYNPSLEQGQRGITGGGDKVQGWDTKIADLKAKLTDAVARGNRVGPDENGQPLDQGARNQAEDLRQQLADAEKQAAIESDNAARESARIEQERQQKLWATYTATPEAPPAVKETQSAYSSMDAALKMLQAQNPEIAAILQGVMDDNAQNKAAYDANMQAMLTGGTVMVNGQPVQVKGVNEVYDENARKIKEMETYTNSMKDLIQGALETQKEEDEKRISKEQEAAEQRMEWDKNNQLRELANQRDEAIESKIARLALTGGIGSSGGNAEIQGAKTQFNNAMQRVREEYGVQATDLSAKFTGLYLQASENYRTKQIQNLRDTHSALIQIQGQGMTNQENKDNAMRGTISEWMKQNEANKKEERDNVLAIVKMAQDSIEANAKAKKDGMMSTKDKLGYTSTLRGEINNNKVIAQANDVLNFYGNIEVGYEDYIGLLDKIEKGEISEKDAALNPAQTAVITSFAKILDPGSVVRNEEYERQVLGQSAPNLISGWVQKLKAGGSGLTRADMEAIKRVSDGLYTSWQEKVQQAIQPTILSIDSWNQSYPEANINYEEVIPINKMFLPEQRVNELYKDTGWEGGGGELSFASDANAPRQGWRTDRHNNPIAFAVKDGQTNEYTKALDRAGISWEYGDPFPENKNMVTVKVNGDPVEASRVVLAETNALQNWYLGPKRPYHKNLLEFGIKNNEDFKALPATEQNRVIETIYKGEVGNGSLLAGIMSGSTAYAQSDDDSVTFEDIGEEETPTDTSSEWLAMWIQDPERAYQREGWRQLGETYGRVGQDFAYEAGSTVGDALKLGKYAAKNISRKVSDVAGPFVSGFSSSLR